jgi:helicase MOV-10
LNEDNYVAKFTSLLYTEECQLEVDIRKYDMDATTLTPDKKTQLYWLTVPGLAEKRPSLLLGDKIFVKFLDNTREEFSGYVHAVQESRVGLKFAPKFVSKYISGMNCHVRFDFNRVCFKRLHRTLDTLKHTPKAITSPFLFPQLNDDDMQQQRIDQALDQFKKHKGITYRLNEQQRRAVYFIQANHAITPESHEDQLPPPYIIFGPPGTGKSSTLAEAIYQIYKNDGTKS